LLLIQGKIDEAIGVLEECIKLCQLAEIRVLFPQIACYLGFAYALARRMDQALPLMEKADEKATVIGRKAGQSLRIAWHGQANVIAGRLEEAERLAQRALELSEESNEEGHHAWTLKLLGDIAASQRSPESQVELYYREALALSDKLEMIPLQGHAYLALGQFHSRSGNYTRGRNELTRAVDLYKKSGMEFWQVRAEASLRELSPSS
jgi:tetratricopeptide (TPR) repeat protein